MESAVIAPDRKIAFQERRVLLPSYPQLENIDRAVEELKSGQYKEGLDAILWLGRNHRKCVAKREGEIVLTKASLQALYNFDWLKEGDFDSSKFNQLYDYVHYLGGRHSPEGFNLQIHPHHSQFYFNGTEETVVCTPNIILYLREGLQKKVK